MRSRPTPCDSPGSRRGGSPRLAVPRGRANPVRRRRAGSVPLRGRRSPCAPPYRATACRAHDALAWRLPDRSHWTGRGSAAATSHSRHTTADHGPEPGRGLGPSTDRSRCAVAGEPASDVAAANPDLRDRGNRPTRGMSDRSAYCVTRHPPAGRGKDPADLDDLPVVCLDRTSSRFGLGEATPRQHAAPSCRAVPRAARR